MPWGVFQSSPAPKGRRYAHQGRTDATTLGFNPRPPRRAGATKDLNRVHSAGMRFNPRPPRRAGATIVVLPIWIALRCFNPRPPRRAGATLNIRHYDPTHNVSILARPEGQALRLAYPLPVATAVFQSSPAPKGRRYETMNMESTTTNGFNPRPPRRAGATLTRLQAIRPTKVSILARPEGQALLYTVQEMPDKQKVSILARPEGQALLVCYPVLVDSVMFQSSPAPKGRRYPERRHKDKCLRLFQSSPAPKGRRYRPGAGRLLGLARFNPRPPRRAGATQARYRPLLFLRKFQSSPAPKGRRYAVIFKYGAGSHLFQSSPAPKGRRYTLLLSNLSTNAEFQSSPAPKGRRYHRQTRRADI